MNEGPRVVGGAFVFILDDEVCQKCGRLLLRALVNVDFFLGGGLAPPVSCTHSWKNPPSGLRRKAFPVETMHE